MGRVNEWAVNRESDGIVYCFADGTTQVVRLEDYLRENPEYTAEDFRQIKELSDGMFFEQHQTDYRYGYMKTDADFDDVAAALPASDPEPCTALLQWEQRRLAVRAALLLLHSGAERTVHRLFPAREIHCGNRPQTSYTSAKRLGKRSQAGRTVILRHRHLKIKHIVRSMFLF